LTTAIGNATVASGHLVPGMSSNPANLGLNRFYQVQVGFQHNSFHGPSADNSHTQFAGVYGVLPVEVYQGSLVFGGGVQKIIDFTDAFHTSNKQASEQGGIYATELGISIEAAQDLFIGGALRYMSGSDELSTTEADTNSLLNPKYRGYGIVVGFLHRTTPFLQLGGSVEFPTRIWVEDKLATWPSDSPQSSVSETWKYRLKRPLVFHAGLAYLRERYDLFYELEWSDWSDLNFASDEYKEGDVAEINREIERELRSTLTHHLGAAVHLPWLPLHAYLGYQYLPVPFSGEYSSNLRASYSFGLSYLLSQQFSVHSSYSHYQWKYRGDRESYDMLVFGVTGHF
jgi:hypothetical protein